MTQLVTSSEELLFEGLLSREHLSVGPRYLVQEVFSDMLAQGISTEDVF